MRRLYFSKGAGPAAIVLTGAEPPFGNGPPVTRPGTERRLIGGGVCKRRKKDEKDQNRTERRDRRAFPNDRISSK